MEASARHHHADFYVGKTETGRKLFTPFIIHHLWRFYGFAGCPPRYDEPVRSFRRPEQMVPLVQLSVKEFTSIVSGIAEKGSSVDVYPLLKRFTVDNISRTAFGIEASTMARPDVVSRQRSKPTFADGSYPNDNAAATVAGTVVITPSSFPDASHSGSRSLVSG